jgi:uncharacterized protein (DUF433 family)
MLIEKTPGVCGGSACVAGTRIPVWTLANCLLLEQPESAILAAYPAIGRAELRAAWAYAREHLDEIASEIEQNEST